MAIKMSYTHHEPQYIVAAYRALLRGAEISISLEDIKKVRQIIQNAFSQGFEINDKYGINRIIRSLYTADILSQEVSIDGSMLIALMVYHFVDGGVISREEIERQFGADVLKLVNGLVKANRLYGKQAAVQSDNFRKLLLTFAEDIRVIILMIADRLCLMRMINHHPNETFIKDAAYEASYLYAPLAHRLGLYAIKGELEDLSLKYTNREIYTSIAHKLSATKVARDAYIDSFVAPIKEKLTAIGLRFDIKGRTKSIFSIYNKMKKQHAEIEDIYDLFAIRIVIDTDIEREKAECWGAYSVVTDMYQPNPARLKDWLSIPKSNGYESLHITVMGSENRWVEVQIRTKRMDEIAEKGLAAHWKYKGVKAEEGLDDWMNNVREVLESAEGGGLIELMKGFKIDLYDKEVFAFTPKGDIYKLPKGATVLDFAFLIHTNLGCRCTGARINNKNQSIKYVVKSGDTIEILTSSGQKPKLDWLNVVTTSKARAKIKQTIKENQFKESEFGKELLLRRFKNRKMEMSEAVLMRLIRKLGYKTVTDFYFALATETLDITDVIEKYTELERKEQEDSVEQRTAEGYVQQITALPEDKNKDDVLIIDNHLKGIEYKLSKCCNPIYGDDVFGFVSTQGSVKIHRNDCPNAEQMQMRYGYRIVKVRWSGKVGSQYATVLRVVGHDDIGIVTNITSIIAKEKNIVMRAISIDSTDGLFQGNITVMVDDTTVLEALIRKLKTIKGVKSVQRN